jgi:MFS family permease
MQIRAGDNAAASRGLARRARVGGEGAFRLLLMGSSVSLLGSQVTAIGYPMLVLYLTGSPITAGWVACVATVPSMLAYIPAGVLVDRSDPWRVMLLSEIGRGCAIAMVVAALALGRASVPLLIAVAVIEQTLEVFSVLAEPRCVGSLVSRDEAGSAFVRIEARTHVVTLLGRPLGGFLFGLWPILPFLSDALSFGVSAATLIGIRSMRLPRLPTSAPHVRASWHLGSDVRDGLRWLCRNRYLRLAVMLCSAATLTAQALIMVILGEAHSGHVRAFMVGMVLAAPGGGGAIGSCLASRLPAMSRNQSLRIQMCVWCVMMAALAIAGGPSFGWMAAVMIVLGFTGALGNVEVGTYLMQNVAHTMLARVTSIGRLMSFGACAIGPVLGGALFQHYGAEKAIVALFVITTILALVSLLAPSMRAENRADGRGTEALSPDAEISVVPPQCGAVTAD